jgi:predicted secreted protein
MIGASLLAVALCAPSFRAVLTDATRTATVPAGSQFIVALKGYASQGYVWNMTSASGSGTVRSEGKQYVPDRAFEALPPTAQNQLPPSQIAGFGGTDLWLFTALKPGTSMLAFRLTLKNGSPPARAAKFTVHVTPGVSGCGVSR